MANGWYSAINLLSKTFETIKKQTLVSYIYRNQRKPQAFSSLFVTSVLTCVFTQLSQTLMWTCL